MSLFDNNPSLDFDNLDDANSLLLTSPLGIMTFEQMFDPAFDHLWLSPADRAEVNNIEPAHDESPSCHLSASVSNSHDIIHSPEQEHATLPNDLDYSEDLTNPVELSDVADELALYGIPLDPLPPHLAIPHSPDTTTVPLTERLLLSSDSPASDPTTLSLVPLFSGENASFSAEWHIPRSEPSPLPSINSTTELLQQPDFEQAFPHPNVYGSYLPSPAPSRSLSPTFDNLWLGQPYNLPLQSTSQAAPHYVPFSASVSSFDFGDNSFAPPLGLGGTPNSMWTDESMSQRSASTPAWTPEFSTPGSSYAPQHGYNASDSASEYNPSFASSSSSTRELSPPVPRRSNRQRTTKSKAKPYDVDAKRLSQKRMSPLTKTDLYNPEATIRCTLRLEFGPRTGQKCNTLCLGADALTDHLKEGWHNLSASKCPGSACPGADYVPEDDGLPVEWGFCTWDADDDCATFRARRDKNRLGPVSGGNLIRHIREYHAGVPRTRYSR